jgi:feruloyl esterase
VALTTAQQQQVSAKAVSACDVVGGQHLGFILDPQQCTYDPAKDATALCTGRSAPTASSAPMALRRA